MRTIKRALALVVTGLLLGACSHKDKDAPLAFVPADTPYVAANLDVLDDGTRQALLSQVDLQMPAQVAQMKSQADQIAATDPKLAQYLRAVAKEFDGKTAMQVAQDMGIDPKGYAALYGLGLAPVLRLELADTNAFNAFVGRMETDNGIKPEVVTLGGQTYQRFAATSSNVQLIIAVVGKQAVLSVLPADAGQPLLRQALGLDRPAKNLQDDGRLADLAKAKGYAPWAVAELDLTKALPLFASGKDPMAQAILKARAQGESAKTGEPVANLMQIPASCQTDAERIAARVPQISSGYTKLDTTNRDIRVDVSLASDITAAFSNLKVELPGLGTDASAPFEVALALPMSQVRTFWSAQADAVAAKPFTCPALDSLNQNFASLGQNMQKAAAPPIGDLLGLHVVLDSFATNPSGGMPKVTGRVLIGTDNPAGLLAMAQVASSLLAGVKVPDDGTPAALPAQVSNAIGEPVWAAKGAKALGVALGAGEDAKLSDMLKQPSGDAGQMMRLHIDGDMYLNWVKLMAQRAQAAATVAAAANPSPTPDDDTQKAVAIASANAQAQFTAMQQQVAHIKDVAAEAHVDGQGLTITSHTEMK